MQLDRPLIQPARLAERMRQQPLVIADCRFDLANPDAGRAAYRTGHIPGAVYFHLDQDLSGPQGEHGGRHPLPDPEVIAAKLGAAGIGPDVPVVVYDNTGAFAARFWWLLRWLGHDEVAVLDGGIAAWERAGLPLSAEPATPAPRQFVPHVRSGMVAAMEEVRDRPSSITVIDARSPQRFAGQPDPLDAWQGHVPGAINRFWAESLAPDGTWKPAAEQAARFAGLEGPSVIHHCGSGVTASANLLAMAIAGVAGSRLYNGSWSDWCTWPGNPLEKK